MKINPCNCGTIEPPIGIRAPSGVHTICCSVCESDVIGDTDHATIRAWNAANPEKGNKRAKRKNDGRKV